MKFEVLKTYILIFLVGLSLLLTFSLWSYKPNHEMLYNNRSKYVNEGDFDLGGKEVRKKEIIKPNSVIFHRKDKFYSFKDVSECHRLFETFQSWTLYDFKTDLGEGPPTDENKIEIIFPTELPLEVIPSLFTLNEETELPTWSFQKIYITFNKEKSLLKVHFLSVDGRQKAMAIISDAANYDLLWSYLTNLDEMTEYIAFEGSGQSIYIPKYSLEMAPRSLTINNIDLNMLVNALFTNPSLVSRNLTDINVVYYTDGQRQMRVSQDRRNMEFINPYQSAYDRMSPMDLLSRSLLNINEYKGWTNEYNLASIDTTSNTIQYQMYYEGYPVYGNELSTIEQQWRNQELFRYKRPLFTIDNSFSGDPIELQSGTDIIYYLHNSSNYDVANIKDIKVGYRLYSHDTAVNTLTLEPVWMLNYNGNWVEIDFDDLQHSKGVS